MLQKDMFAWCQRWFKLSLIADARQTMKADMMRATAQLGEGSLELPIG
jgi:hypothetical protein